MLVPSRSLIFSRAVFIDTGSRKGNVETRVVFSNPPQSFGGVNHFYSETLARFAQVAFVKCDNRVGLPIHCRLQNQFVAGIAELRAPAKERPHRFCKSDQAVHIVGRIRCAELRRQSMLG